MKYDTLKHWAFDIETFSAVFSAGFMNLQTSEYYVFEISRYKDQSKELFEFLNLISKSGHNTIGFNSMFFDQPVLHHFLRIYLAGMDDPDDLVEELYLHAQYIIKEASRFHREKKPLWQDIDLYKINHYDNRAKATSLKKIEVFLNMETVEELPHDFHDPDLTEEEVSEVVSYMYHDILATKLFADHCEKEITFRFSLIDKFGPAVLNYSDSKIGAELMNKELISKMGYDKVYKNINGKREPIQTNYPDGFKVEPLLFPYLEFKTEAGKAIFEFFKSQTIYPTIDGEGTGAKSVFSQLDLRDVGELSDYVKHDLTNTELNKQKTRKFLDDLFTENISLDVVSWDKKDYPLLDKVDFPRMSKYSKMYWDKLRLTKESFDEKWSQCKETFKLPTKLKHLNVKIGNVTIDLGVGGAHAAILPGIYEEDDEYEIWDADIVSMYPSLSIENFLSPKQYSADVWVDTYGEMKTQRISYPKGSPENKALKLALNSTYGNSSNKFSPIRDPAYTISTCINGQLSIIMFCENLLEIEGLKIATINTDGILAFVPKKHKDLYLQKCKDFEQKTNLLLEYEQYSKLLQRDVNNFLYK